MRRFQLADRNWCSCSMIPRYLEGKVPLLKPRVRARNLWTAKEVLKKNTSDLSLLISILEALLN